MTDIAPWSFYGRRSELQQMQRILERRRWFFLQISGRRRIGKTALIQEALRDAGIDKTLYIQIPDSDPAGVVAACNGYLETFGIDARVASLGELAQLIGRLASAGYVVALDEFQYFHRKQLADFCCNEADNWFLRELRGRYDMVLQYLARHPGCTNADIEATMVELSGPGEVRQVGGYLKILSERYRMIERRLPIFSPARARSGRYYIRNNFLRAWLSGLAAACVGRRLQAGRGADRPGRCASG